MEFSFVIKLLGQRFALASAPDTDDEAAGPFLSVASETERAPIGFAADEYYEEEERRR